MPGRQGESPRRLCTNFLCLPTLPPLICTSCNRSGVGSRPRGTSVGVGKMANPILLAPANGPSATNCLSHQPTPYNPRLPDNPRLPAHTIRATSTRPQDPPVCPPAPAPTGRDLAMLLCGRLPARRPCPPQSETLPPRSYPSQKLYGSVTNCRLCLRTEVFKALIELLDTPGRVEDALLARVERVRLGGNFNIDDGIGLTVNLNGLAARHRRTSEKRRPGGEIAEHNRVVFRMNIGLHSSFLCCLRGEQKLFDGMPTCDHTTKAKDYQNAQVGRALFTSSATGLVHEQ